ncbi:hypothetical protein [Hymenobacter pini]|uniref:hypothetical protein n=1 Tax=Hymenobacter pini TaxID=2880879 RepID=UPI001CF3F2E3|nr:hypothetical protein [Hymenobacter pini]MCA8829408.1 hypothetical protein [Hymenobacter pini]
METPTNTTTGSTEEPVVIYHFESVTLTENLTLKLTGTRFKGEVVEEFQLVVNQYPHPDLLLVLRKLTFHLVMLTEQLDAQTLYPDAAKMALYAPNSLLMERALSVGVETGEVYEHPLLENFRCLAVKFSNKGTVLVGERRSKYKCFGKRMELKTPPIVGVSLDEAEEGSYPFFEQFTNTLASLHLEARAYLEGKYGAGGDQLSLFGKQPDEEPKEHFLQDIVDSAAGFTSLTISSNAGSVTLEKGKAPRSYNGQTLDEDE